MGFDSRAVANALLDIAEGMQIEISNLSLNKIMFFAHTEYLLRFDEKLVQDSFEAWQFGPVLPVIYHQFKKNGDRPIGNRATFICHKTGEDRIFSWECLENHVDILSSVLNQYGRMSSYALVQLSHIRGGPWDKVWNASSDHEFGMCIPDHLIRSSSLECDGPCSRSGNKLVH